MIINTHELTSPAHPLARQIYNGLDTCLTYEIWEVLQTLIDDSARQTYTFERAMQAPLMEMMLRGFLVNQYERKRGLEELAVKWQRLDTVLQRYAFAVWGKGLNPNSPKQLIEFFYGAMRLPEQFAAAKGVRRVSTNRESLEKLEHYWHAMPIVAVILAMRDVAKTRSVLETEIDPDGRMRTSYNIGGTETWRLSSSSNAMGTGTNLQNITGSLRHIFIADPGWKMCGIDLEQAESREVGWLCGTLFDDWAYLDACYGGDLHTQVCRMNWKALPWTGDAKADKALAESPAYRDYSYRDLAKKLGHGSNYYGKPFTMARHAKVVTRMVEEFQAAYFEAFPGIQQWHRWTAQQLQTTQCITTPWGVTRYFFGRPNDDSTLREAIAFSPQSSTALRMNLAIYNIWQDMGRDIGLLAQVHDAVYFLYREQDELEVVPRALHHINSIRMTHGDRELIVPGEAKVGWNWGNFASESDVAKGRAKRPNLDGMMKFKPGVQDARTRTGLLDRRL